MSPKENKITDEKLGLGLGKTLAFLMKECDIDDARLSRETGVPASSISRMRLNPDSNPTASTLRPIAKFFSVSIDQLLGDEPFSTNRLPGTHNPTPFTAAKIPIVDWELIPSFNQTEQIENKIQSSEWISTEKEVSASAFALIIPTDSLGLALRKGSLVIIDPQVEQRDGDLILLQEQADDSLVIKQFLKDGNECYIKSVNPEIKGLKLLPSDVQVIGVIIETRFSLQEKVKKKSLREMSQVLTLSSLTI